MNSLKSLVLASAVFSLLAGCNSLGGVPQFKSSQIAPQDLHPGDTALITIDVKDKNNIIHSIVGVVKEAPDIKLPLHDDGTEGDVKAADGTWSLAVQVPPKVPPGSFNLTFTAYRSDGVAVPIRDDAGNISSLTAGMPLEIRSKQ